MILIIEHNQEIERLVVRMNDRNRAKEVVDILNIDSNENIYYDIQNKDYFQNK